MTTSTITERELTSVTPDTDLLTAVIDLDLPGPRISRHIYGHFAEHLGRCIYGGFYVGEDSSIPNEGGIRLDVVEALRALHIPNLRWPGGCFADEYHWRDGVGPRDERARTVNSHWGDVVEDNSFGTHEFMQLCELLGAEPYINGNVGSGTVREMSEWVEYLTRADDSPMAALRRANGRDKPWQLPFFGIGNEAWGCGGNMTAPQYAHLARQYATYVRNHGDRPVYKIAAGANVDDYRWTETLMKELAELGGVNASPHQHFQGLSLHYYTYIGSWEDKGDATGFDTDAYYLTMKRARRMEELVSGHAAVMDSYDPERKIGLVVDEWGTWWNVEEGTNPGFLYQQNTLRDALVASVHFDTFHRFADRVAMANIAQTVNVLQAMILTDPDSGALVLTPSYHVFEMNTGHHDADSLSVGIKGTAPTREVEGSELSLFSASASVKDDTALISLSNLDASSARTVVLDLRGRSVTGSSARLLSAPTLQTHNTPEQPDAVSPVAHAGIRLHAHGLEVDLPAHSYVTVKLQLGR
jgi:alpha-N-arabinofuranosidase